MTPKIGNPERTESRTRDKTAREVAKILGVSLASMRDYSAAGCPRSSQPRPKPYLFDASEVSEWMASRGLVGGKTGRPESGSPALERLRNAKADQAEMDRDYQRGTLVPRSELDAGLRQAGQLIRAAGERIAREYGNPAAEILNDALDDAEAIWSKTLGNESSPRITGCVQSERQDAATPQHA